MANLFTPAQLREFDADLADHGRYPDDLLRATHDAIVEDFETITGVAVGPTARTRVHSGNGTALLMLRDRLPIAVTAAATRASGTQTWTALTSDELAALVLDTRTGLLTRESGVWPCGTGNVRITYTAGHPTPPGPLVQAAKVLARQMLLSSEFTDRIISRTDETGTSRLASAGFGRASWFGIPQVDSTLDRYRRRLPGVA